MPMVLALVALAAGLLVAGPLTVASGPGMGLLGLVAGSNVAFLFIAYALRRREPGDGSAAG